MIKGTLFHELLNLPLYWKDVKASAPLSYPLTRLTFGKHARQYVLIAEPVRPPLGWVIYWHGGGWQFGSPEQFQKTAAPWLDAGYGVLIPSYRRLPWNDFRAIRKDTVDALVACRQYWKDKGHEPFPPVLLLGMSAGGHLAAITGLDAGIWQQAGLPGEQIKGVVACGGVLDFSLMKNNPIIRLLAGSPGGETFTLANPMAHLGNKIDHQVPPFLLIHGTSDGMVPYQAAVNFQKQYQLLPNATHCDLITLPQGTHLDTARWMFFDTPLRQTIVTQAEEWLSKV